MGAVAAAAVAAVAWRPVRPTGDQPMQVVLMAALTLEVLSSSKWRPTIVRYPSDLISMGSSDQAG